MKTPKRREAVPETPGNVRQAVSEKTPVKLLAQKVKALILVCGKNQTELAVDSQMSQSDISAIARDSKNPYAWQLYFLARAMRTTVELLLDDSISVDEARMAVATRTANLRPQDGRFPRMITPDQNSVIDLFENLKISVDTALNRLRDETVELKAAGDPPLIEQA